MRLLYLHQYFNTPEMPGSTRSYEMARRFVAAGHEVHVITSRRRGEREGGGTPWVTTVEEGVNVHWCWVPYSNEMGVVRRMIAFCRFAAASAHRAVKVGGDVIFATSTPLTIALPAVYAHLRLRKPFVFEVRDLWPEIPIAIGVLRNPLLKWAARALERMAYHFSTEIIALSPGMRDGIIARGYPSERIQVVPNGSDITLFQAEPDVSGVIRCQYPWLESRPVVLYAGTIGFMNGVQYLARVAGAVRSIDPDVRFVVVGDGAQRDAVAELARDLGVLGETFFMLPPIPKAEVVKWYCTASVVTCLFIDVPAMQANSANKFFDGLAAGRPIAINYGGWHADLLRAEGAGIVLPPDDAGTAAELLVEFMASSRQLVVAGVSARRLAETCFDRDLLSRQVLEVLERAGQP